MTPTDLLTRLARRMASGVRRMLDEMEARDRSCTQAQACTDSARNMKHVAGELLRTIAPRFGDKEDMSAIERLARGDGQCVSLEEDQVRPVDTYRTMLREELAAVLRGTSASDEDIMRVVEDHREQAKRPTRDWSPDEGAVALLWSGIARMVLGRLDYLEDALVVLRDHPEAARTRQCRYYLGAFRVLPLPEWLHPVAEPQRVIEWLRPKELRWSDPLGRFVDLSGSADGQMPPVVPSRQ
jgi:hypothetical protein